MQGVTNFGFGTLVRADETIIFAEQDVLSRTTAFLDHSWTRRLARGALAASLALVLTATLAPRAMADDDEDSIEEKIMKSIFGINDKDKIDYRERPGLVVPPSMALPQPETTASTPHAAWPKDVDKQPKKKKADVTRKDRRYSDPTIEESRPLTPAELDKGRIAGAGTGASAGQGGGSANPDVDGQRVLRPNELGYRGGLFGNLFGQNSKKEEAATPPPERPRTSLIEPPSGYMAPATGQVYGLSNRKEAPKPFNLEDRGINNN